MDFYFLDFGNMLIACEKKNQTHKPYAIVYMYNIEGMKFGKGVTIF